MPGEEELRVASSAHLAASTLTPTTTSTNSTTTTGTGSAASAATAAATTSTALASASSAASSAAASSTIGNTSTPVVTGGGGGPGHVLAPLPSVPTLSTIPSLPSVPGSVRKGTAPSSTATTPTGAGTGPPTSTTTTNTGTTTTTGNQNPLVNLNGSTPHLSHHNLKSEPCLSLGGGGGVVGSGVIGGGSGSVSGVLGDKETVGSRSRSDDEDDDVGGSKLELELQFGGIDNENVELDMEEGGAVGGGSGVVGGAPPSSTTTAAGTTLAASTAAGPNEGGEGGEGEEDGEKTAVECTEVIIPDQTFAEKCLFYTTAFFILLAVFSLFAFLFLVPFVIDPAFTTIFMEFDPEPAFCVTVSHDVLLGLSNCSWTSCREGCTREVFQCSQIKVDYLPQSREPPLSETGSEIRRDSGALSTNNNNYYNNVNNNYYSNNQYSNSVNNYVNGGPGQQQPPPFTKNKQSHHQPSSNPYNHLSPSSKYSNHNSNGPGGGGSGGAGVNVDPARNSHSGSSNHNKKRKHNKVSSELRTNSVNGGGDGGGNGLPPHNAHKKPRDPWIRNAHLYPNVKGCGYPPKVVCASFIAEHGEIGRNFSCFYSKVDPGLVVTNFDMTRVILDLVYSMAIPIPSFIISVVYLIFAYFRIYNTDASSPQTANSNVVNVNASSTNNNIQAPGSHQGGSSEPDGETSLSADEKTRIIQRSTSRGLNAVTLTDKLLPNSGKGIHSQVIEMNDLAPQLHQSADGDLLLPRRNNRAPERNGPTNPAAKNKGEMNGHNGSRVSKETERYLEPGFLPEKNMLPPIELPLHKNVLHIQVQQAHSQSQSRKSSMDSGHDDEVGGGRR